MPGSLLDSNVWIAAVFSTHPIHRQAQQVLQQATPADPAIFCRSTQQSFLKLVSTPAMQKTYGATGITNRDALAALGAFIVLPQVCEREEPPQVAALWHRLADRSTASPKVWMDAYLAAFAISGALRLATLDLDFKVYEPPGLDLLLLQP